MKGVKTMTLLNHPQQRCTSQCILFLWWDNNLESWSPHGTILEEPQTRQESTHPVRLNFHKLSKSHNFQWKRTAHSVMPPLLSVYGRHFGTTFHQVFGWTCNFFLLFFLLFFTSLWGIYSETCIHPLQYTFHSLSCSFTSLQFYIQSIIFLSDNWSWAGSNSWPKNDLNYQL